MKLNKTLMIAALVAGSVFAADIAVRAQDSTNTPPAGGPPGGGQRGRGGPSIEMLTTNLSLTADQIPKVKAVLDEQRQKMGELRNETDQQVRRTKMQALRTDTTAKMKEILTAEQFAKYEKMGPGMRGNRPPGGAPGGAGAPPPQN
jgi:Spy/CpxP family protein refolding chaperone